MSRVEVSAAVAPGRAEVVTRCEVHVAPARSPGAVTPPSVEPGLEPSVEPGLASLSDALAPVTLLADERGQVSWASGPAEALLGRAAEDLVGRRLDEVVVAGEGARALDADVSAALAGEAVDRRDVRSPMDRRARPLAARVERASPACVVVTLDDPQARARAASRRRALDALERLVALETAEELARGLVEAAVPGLADVALVRVQERDGAVAARRHRDPAREPALQALEALLPVRSLEAARAGAAGLRVEGPALLDDLSAAAITSATGLEEVGRLARELDLRAVAVVPVALRDGVALLVLGSCGARALDADDLRLAEVMTRRAAPLFDRLSLARAVQVRDRKLSALAHDLRNPAAAISMAADILISRLPPGDSGSSLKMIHRAANQINALIQKIVDDRAAAEVG